MLAATLVTLIAAGRRALSKVPWLRLDALDTPVKNAPLPIKNAPVTLPLAVTLVTPDKLPTTFAAFTLPRPQASSAMSWPSLERAMKASAPRVVIPRPVEFRKKPVVGWSVYAMLGLTDEPLARSVYVARRRVAVKLPRIRSCPLDIFYFFLREKKVSRKKKSMVLVLQMNKPTKRVDPARERWKRLMKDIDAMVDRNGCWDAKHDAGIAPHYVRGPLSEGQLETETVYYTLDGAQRVTGFLMARWTGREMKTIAVCSEATAPPGTGKAIVLHSLADARLRQKQQASLRALPHVFGYYARFGYARAPINAKGTNVDGYLHTKNLRNAVNWRVAPGTQTPGTRSPARAR